MEFKIGDEVTLDQGFESSYMKQGETGIVTGVYPNIDSVTVELGDKIPIRFYTFELVKTLKENSMKFEQTKEGFKFYTNSEDYFEIWKDIDEDNDGRLITNNNDFYLDPLTVRVMIEQLQKLQKLQEEG